MLAVLYFLVILVHGNLAQGGNSIYGGVDYKRCSGGPKLTKSSAVMANLTCHYKFQQDGGQNNANNNTF